MTLTKVVAYRTSDGRLFTDRDAAAKHQLLIELEHAANNANVRTVDDLVAFIKSNRDAINLAIAHAVHDN